MENRYTIAFIGIFTTLVSLAGHAQISREIASQLDESAKPIIGLDAEEQKFLQILNDYRKANGLDPVQLSFKLTKAAEWMSEDMAANNYLDHNDSMGRSPLMRHAIHGYTDNPQAENILVGAETAEKAFELWRTSPGHNRNMLHPRVKVIGIARAKNLNTKEYGPIGWWWTTGFGGWAYPDDVIQ